MRNISRFKEVCREKGVFAAFIKMISYLAFVLKKNRFEKAWKEGCLKSDRLLIKGWNTGPKVFWDGIELTKGIGLNTSIFVNGKWQDSSKAAWKLLETGPGRLRLGNIWKLLPIRQEWIISSLGDGKVSCEVKLEPQKDIEFIEQKFTIMVSERFNLWFDAENKAKAFPQFKDWTDITEVKKDSLFIGVKSDIDKTLPVVVLKKEDFRPKDHAQIQNSDFRIRSRLLNFVASSRDASLKYRKGVSVFFKMELDVK